MKLFFCVAGRAYSGDKNVYTRIHLYDGSWLDFYFGADTSIERAAFMLPDLIKKQLGNRWRQYVATEIPQIKPTKRKRGTAR